MSRPINRWVERGGGISGMGRVGTSVANRKMFRTMPALAWAGIVVRTIRLRNLIAAAMIGDAQLDSPVSARSFRGTSRLTTWYADRNLVGVGIVASMMQLLRAGLGSVALLAMSCSFANAERFSIKCAEAGYFYVSFATESAKVVEETLSGFALKGRIDKIEGERIDFHVAIPGRPDMDLVWDGSKKTLTVLAIPGDKYRTGNVFECAGTELRSMLSKYDSMPP